MASQLGSSRFESRFSSGFTSRFGSDFGAYHKPKKPVDKPDNPLGGVGDFIGNLVKDVRDTVVGLPMGVLHMASQSPLTSFKEIGLAVWQDWEPLVHGDVDEWWDNFTAHPLSPILDVAGFVTLGAGTAARGVNSIAKVAGAVTAEGAVVDSSSALVKAARVLGGSKTVQGLDAAGNPAVLEMVGRGSARTIDVPGLPEVSRHYHSNPIIRARERGLERIGQAIGQSKAVKSGKPGTETLDVALDRSKGPYAVAATEGVRGRFGDAAKVNKLRRKENASRAMGFQSSVFSAVAAARHLFDAKSPMTVKIRAARDIEEQMRDQFLYHGMRSGTKQKRGRVVAKGYTMIADPQFHTKVALPKTWDGPGMHDFIVTRMAKEGNWMTKDVNKAYRDADGNVLVVRKNAMDGYANEASNSTAMLEYLWNKPTMIWKTLVLAYSPRFFVNNVVGNSIMYFAATNPKAAIEGLYDAYKANGHKRALSEVEKLSGTPFLKNLGYESQGQGAIERAAAWDPASIGKSRLKSGLYPMTHRVSESLIREATMHWQVKRTPEYWANRALGHSHEASVQNALAIPEVRQGMREGLDNVLGNYSYLTKTEQRIKSVIPFYTWDRAIVRHTRELVMNRPYEAMILAKIGQEGTDETIKKLGKIPDFLKGAIPLTDLDLGPGKYVFSFLGVEQMPGRTSVLTTTGVNPYATVADLADVGASVLGINEKRVGETLGSQLNPFLASGAEWLTGTDLISGAPTEGGGALSQVFGNVAESLPQVRLLDTLRKGAPKPKGDDPLLFAGTANQQLLSLLGLPVKNMSPEAAEEIYYRQSKTKKPKRFEFAASHWSSVYGSTPDVKQPAF